MRFHLKKVVTYGLTSFVCLLLVINFYNRDLWQYSVAPPPWGSDFVLPREKRLALSGGEKFHAHLQDVVTKTTTTQKPRETTPRLWMEWNHFADDRIVAQMRHRPRHILAAEAKKEKPPMKTILLYQGVGHWNVKGGQEQFRFQECPVQDCILTGDSSQRDKADAVMFHHSGGRPPPTRPPNQVWILYMLESPYHTPGLSGLNHAYNWTATYRHDSVIVAPYEKFVPYNDSVLTLPQNKSYAAGKTKKVAWFVSNCGGRNGRREYATELSKYIQVDIYGACGPFKCPRHNSQKCFDLLNKEYKFYLAFENSNCRDYITEKFFVNGLGNDVLPIVMGAAPEDYKRASPPHSYIHVDDFPSAKELADYLHKLDQNDDLYNEYFRWKGTGRFINTFFWCRLCSLVHEAPYKQHQSYKDLERWWRGPGVCIGDQTWRQYNRTTPYIIDNYLDVF